MLLGELAAMNDVPGPLDRHPVSAIFTLMKVTGDRRLGYAERGSPEFHDSACQSW